MSSFSNESFLRINVPYNATKADLINAITAALATTDIPIFSSNHRMSAGAVPGVATPGGPPTSGNDGVVMLMRQEGW